MSFQNELEIHRSAHYVTSHVFQRSLKTHEVTLNDVLTLVWNSKPYEPCKQCKRSVHTTDGLCYPCQLQQSPEFHEHMRIAHMLRTGELSRPVTSL